MLKDIQFPCTARLDQKGRVFTKRPRWPAAGIERSLFAKAAVVALHPTLWTSIGMPIFKIKRQLLLKNVLWPDCVELKK